MSEVLDRIAVALVAVTARALTDAAGEDLTLLGWRVLVLLGGPERVRLSDVANRLGLSKPSASKLVQRLSRRGLVRVGRDPDDRRAIAIVLTPDGRRLRDAVLERRRGLLALALSPGLSPAEDGALATLAGRLADLA